MIMTVQKRNCGFVLPVGMIFLVLLSLLSVGALRDVLLEEKMASNFIDKQMSFERAESALKVVERFDIHQSVNAIRASAGYNDTSSNPTGAPDFSTYDWTNNAQSYEAASVALGTLPDQESPRVVIEELYATESLKQGKEIDNPATSEHYFRVTVRATGHTDSASTLLQGIIKR